jgi:recombination protein RecA
MAVSPLQKQLAAMRDKQNLKIGALSEFDMNAVPFPVGNSIFDALTGIGGFPGGRVTELFGLPSSGKTTSALMAAARQQAKLKAGEAEGAIMFLDYERSLDEAYCKSLGLDVDDEETFIYAQPDSFEQGANGFRTLLKAGYLSMGIFDSVATMVTDNELEADTGKATMADRAKVMAQFMRQITGHLATQKVAAIFLNHLQDVVDISPMGQRMKAQGINRTTTPGGRALKFAASMRVEFTQVGQVKKETVDPTMTSIKVTKQTRVKATVVKNKVGIPFLTGELINSFGTGFSQAHAVTQVLAGRSVIKKTGSWYTFPPQLALDADHIKMQGEDAIVKALQENPEWLAKLTEVTNKVLSQFGMDKVDPTEYDSETGDLINTVTGEVKSFPVDPSVTALLDEDETQEGSPNA